jgi:protein-tyrosine phosphatase
VYVHCANGHGRSAVLAAARMLAGGGGGGTVDGAVDAVRAARPRVRLNARQRAAVDAWWEWRQLIVGEKKAGEKRTG